MCFEYNDGHSCRGEWGGGFWGSWSDELAMGRGMVAVLISSVFYIPSCVRRHEGASYTRAHTHTYTHTCTRILRYVTVANEAV